MKAILAENGTDFWITFEPETDAEALELVRLGMNATKERPTIGVQLSRSKNGESPTAFGWIVLGKRARPGAGIEPAKGD
ncbi:MAG TPA: hypothetical protein VM238_17010 [Phycisphaerae bacterium]|nr:hypothetical protein [Phycisphaerae bacterium]